MRISKRKSSFVCWKNWETWVLGLVRLFCSSILRWVEEPIKNIWQSYSIQIMLNTVMRIYIFTCWQSLDVFLPRVHRHLCMHTMMKVHSSYFCHDRQGDSHILNAFIAKENNCRSMIYRQQFAHIRRLRCCSCINGCQRSSFMFWMQMWATCKKPFLKQALWNKESCAYTTSPRGAGCLPDCTAVRASSQNK